MKTKIVKVEMTVCWRCGYTWKPMVKNPVKCPSCQARQDKGPKNKKTEETTASTPTASPEENE